MVNRTVTNGADMLNRTVTNDAVIKSITESPSKLFQKQNAYFMSVVFWYSNNSVATISEIVILVS